MRKWLLVLAPVTLVAVWALGSVGEAAHKAASAAAKRPQTPVAVETLLETVPVSENVPPERCVIDPYANFNGVAVDPDHDFVVMSAPNIRSVMLYSRTAGGNGQEVTQPLGMISGPRTRLSGMSGVMVDPVRQQFYGIETDIGDSVAAFPYSARGDARAHLLAIPIGGWGISMNEARKEFVIGIEDNDQLLVYALGAKDVDKPKRQIRGNHTLIADPRGLFWDGKHHEIVVATLGNWSRAAWDADYNGGGEYRPPSIEVFSETANHDTAPLRVIQGDQTALNLPSGLAVDPEHDEIIVANAGNGSVTVYSRTAKGNIAPIRVIQGPHAMLEHPIGIALDLKHNELWVANWGHTAEVFDRTASGDATPKRVIRSAPPGVGATGLSVIPALTLDTKRNQLLVPN